MKTKLAALLEREEDRLCAAWNERLSETAQLAGKRMAPRPTSVTRLLTRDVVRMLRDQPPESHRHEWAANADRLGQRPDWRINLSQALEVLLTGEVVVRAWAVRYLDATESEQLEMFEAINRAFHQLMRLHLRHYCEECHRAAQAAEE